jgi:hypothetical protein
MLGALVLAASFAARRRAEIRLVRSNMMLEQERDNFECWRIEGPRELHAGLFLYGDSLD